MDRGGEVTGRQLGSILPSLNISPVSKYKSGTLYFLASISCFPRCGAVDGYHKRLLTPFGQHKEEFSNKNAT